MLSASLNKTFPSFRSYEQHFHFHSLCSILRGNHVRFSYPFLFSTFTISTCIPRLGHLEPLFVFFYSLCETVCKEAIIWNYFFRFCSVTYNSPRICFRVSAVSLLCGEARNIIYIYNPVEYLIYYSQNTYKLVCLWFFLHFVLAFVLHIFSTSAFKHRWTCTNIRCFSRIKNNCQVFSVICQDIPNRLLLLLRFF